MSPREEVAHGLAETCIFGSLNDSYGVNVAKAEANGKTYWGITFAKARILDGSIRVYSPNFILITWQTAIRDLPSKGREVFKSEQAAKAFLMQTFITPYL